MKPFEHWKARIQGDASVGWLRLGALILALAALAALLINRRLPT